MATPNGGNASTDDGRKWGTQVMGPTSGPSPDYPQGSLAQGQPRPYYHNQQQPYLVYTPVQKPNQNPCEYAINLFDSFSQRAEGIGRNIWHNLTTGASVSRAAWGKVNLATKAITEGGFESLFRQNFPSNPNEKLKKTFACYLSTMTGPVAGTLYLSTARLAFCSDRPLSFGAPSGQEMWSYYKVSVPLGNIENVNPVVMRQNPQEKYIHIITVDAQEFWFMGLVNFEKASHHIMDSVSGFRAASNAARSVTIR